MAGIEPIHLAMSASVDFELAFTVARDMEAPCRAALATIGTPLSVIGEVNESGRNEVLMPGGERRPLPGVAWRHQTDDVLQVLKADRDAE